MSETWLKNNDLLIKHVTIPGYDMLYKNREKVCGGGVGFYISNNLKYEHQKYLESRFDELEHLWVNYQVEIKTALCYLASFTVLLLLQTHLVGYQNLKNFYLT